MSPGWLHADQQRVMVLEASWAKPEEAKDYLAGHIPGAVHANTDHFENGYPRWHLLAPKELQAAIGRLGIAPAARVVVYGRKPVVAARVWWILHYAGVADVRFLNGGYEAWTGAGYPGETAVQVRPDRRRSKLADVRSREEFEGQVSGYSYLAMKGRLPKAIHIEDRASGLLRPPGEIRRLWLERGLRLDGSKEIVFYCGSGWRSSLAFLYAAAMGMQKIRNYSDGWSGWSTDFQQDPGEKRITPGWRQTPSSNPRVSR